MKLQKTVKNHISVFYICFCALLFMPANIKAQSTDSVVWRLTANQSATVSGNLSASDQVLYNMQATYANSVQKASPVGTIGSWPAESTENPNRYMQFSVCPKFGYAFDLIALSMKLYALGGSNMHANVYYSKDSTFNTRIQVGSTITLPSSAPSSSNITLSPSITLDVQEKLYIRIYPWYPVQITTKYVVASAVTVTGSTRLVKYMNTSVDKLTALVQSAHEESSYTISGANLLDNVLISPPMNFEISSDNGVTWINSSSQISLPILNGAIIGQPFSLKVRINASDFGSFSGEVIHTSSGLNKKVSISGINFPPEPNKPSVLHFGAVTGTSAEVLIAGGTGQRRLLVIKEGSAVSWIPIDGSLPSNINSDYSHASELLNGNYAVYDGSDTSVVITGLQSNKSYFLAAYEYNCGLGNSQNYLSTPATASVITTAIPNFLCSKASISFGTAVVSSDTIIKSYELAGHYLEPANDTVTITAPEGFLISLDSNSVSTQSIRISYTSATLPATKVYVKFIPSNFKDYNAAIINAGGSASALSVQVTGKGVAAIIDTVSPIGFATLTGGTTGGKDGAIVLITSAEQLAASLKEREGRSTSPIIYYIQGQITGYSTEIAVKRTGNLSILGVGNNAEFAGFGMKIVECQNVIVRNIKFSDCTVDEGDGLSVDGSSNVWVDHCTFTDSPSIDLSGNNHDGALDIKNGSYSVTISYNRFSNHRKTCLLGASPSLTSDSVMTVTYFRNWFDGTYSRHPRVRFARAHVLNNLYSAVGVVPGGGYGIFATCYSQILAEANYIENTPMPDWISKMYSSDPANDEDPAGYLKSVNNYLVSSGTLYENLGGFNFNPRDYYAYSPAQGLYVKQIVTENAGSGLLNIITTTDESAYKGERNFHLMQNYPNPFNPSTNINFTLEKDGQATLKVYDILGREIRTLINAKLQAGVVHSVRFNASNLPSGVYFYSLESGQQKQIKKLLLLK